MRDLELEIGRRYRGRVLRVHPSRKPSNISIHRRGQTTTITIIGDRDSANLEANGDYSLIKRIQLFIGAHNEALSIVAMRVCNPSRSPVGIHR
jgi:hypothetical protein